MLTTRLVKVAMVASLALLALLVAVDNLLDYGSNYEFVRHVLSMDTTFPNNTLKWRAITEPALWSVAYWLIILTEAVVGVLLAFAALRLATTLRSSARMFNAAKRFAVLGVGLGFLLWFTGFVVVGGEWLAMWQSRAWNAEDAAFRIYITLLVVIVFVSLPDGELDS